MVVLCGVTLFGINYLSPFEFKQKKIHSEEPTGVGRFLLSKFLILTFTLLYLGKYWVKRKICHTKVVGIERTFPKIPQDIPHCFILGQLPHPLPRRKYWFYEKSFQPKVLAQNTYNIILKPPTVRTLMITEIDFFFKIVFVFTPSPKSLGRIQSNFALLSLFSFLFLRFGDPGAAGPLVMPQIIRVCTIRLNEK